MGCAMHIFLIAYFGTQIVAIQPMESMEQCRTYAAEVMGKLDDIGVEWVESEGSGMDPRAISLSCIFRDARQ